jgi:small subunit ribosomal protein S3Ae
MANKNKGKKKEKRKIVRKTNVVLKKKKKKWTSLLAPKTFGGGEIGESLIIDSQELIGRRVISSLSSFNRGRNTSIKVIFEGKEIVEGACVCEPKGYYILNSFARRIVKKGKTKVFQSLKLKTKDNVDVVIKIVLVTRKKISRGTATSLREALSKFLSESVKKGTFESNLDSIINYSFQKKIKENMKKVYPVGSLEIVLFKKA